MSNSLSKMEIIHKLLLKLLPLKESFNLIGQEDFDLQYLKNKNFRRQGVFRAN